MAQVYPVTPASILSPLVQSRGHVSVGPRGLPSPTCQSWACIVGSRASGGHPRRSHSTTSGPRVLGGESQPPCLTEGEVLTRPGA